MYAKCFEKMLQKAEPTKSWMMIDERCVFRSRMKHIFTLKAPRTNQILL